MKYLQTGIAAAVAGNFALPIVAFAEESESAAGADILIPKAAEFVPALVVFLIIMFILGKFVWPIVLNMMNEREKKIEEGIADAEAAKVTAADARTQADALVADARRQASEIVLAARNEADGERSRIVAEAHAEAEDIIGKARDRALDEQQRIYADATDSIAKVSVSIAGRIVGDVLSDDVEKQRELIKKYIGEVGSLNG